MVFITLYMMMFWICTFKFNVFELNDKNTKQRSQFIPRVWQVGDATE